MNAIDFPVRLLDGEQILWSGQPIRGVLFTARDWFLIPFSVLWCGFAIFWEASVIWAHAPGFFSLWGVPFVVMGLYMAVGRFFADAWLRRSIRYALTNRRILIARSGGFARLTSVSLERMPDMQMTEWRDGRGTIRFGSQPLYWGSGGWSMGFPSADPTPQLIGIEDAQGVFDRIQRASRNAA